SRASALSPTRCSATACVISGVSISQPGAGTGSSAPRSSTCGGRPGEKMRSEILSDRRIIIATRFGNGTRALADIARIMRAASRLPHDLLQEPPPLRHDRVELRALRGREDRADPCLPALEDVHELGRELLARAEELAARGEDGVLHLPLLL